MVEKKKTTKKRKKSSFINTKTMKRMMTYLAGQYGSGSKMLKTQKFDLSDLQSGLWNVAIPTLKNNRNKLVKAGYLKSDSKGNFSFTEKGVEAEALGKFSYNRWEPTMRKKFREVLADSFRQVAKGSNEYSIMIDFERRYKSPERIVFLRGGKGQTVHIPDFEMFGHTHPNRSQARPSLEDLVGMSNNPDFVVASKNNWKDWDKKDAKFDISLIQIKDRQRYNAFTKKYWYEVQYSKKKQKELKDKYYNEILWPLDVRNKLKAKLFEEQTGIRIWPYRKNMMVELPLDDIKEKNVPTISSSRLKKYQRSPRIQNIKKELKKKYKKRKSPGTKKKNKKRKSKKKNKKK